jgi:hypothetical protein
MLMMTKFPTPMPGITPVILALACQSFERTGVVLDV